MRNSAQLRRECKNAARLEIQRGGLWKCIGATALMVIPEMLMSIALSVKAQPIMELLNQASENENADLDQVMSYSAELYGYLGVYLLASLLILAPLFLGMMRYCACRAHGQTGEFSDMVVCFTGFKRYLRAIRTTLCIVLFAVLWGVPVLGGVTALCVVLSLLLGTSEGGMIFCILLTFVLAFLATFFVVARVYRYLPAFILQAEDETLGSWRAVRESTALFKRRTWELFVFLFSFLGWDFLSACTGGLLSVYVYPYTYISLTHYVDALRAPEMPEHIAPSIAAQ